MADMPGVKKGNFASWIEHHGRTDDICTVMDWEPVYIYPKKYGILSREKRYIESVRLTRRLYRSTDGYTVTMLPPPFMPIVNQFDRHRIHIYDIHSGIFTDRRWRPFLKLILKSFKPNDILLAHNEYDEDALNKSTKSRVVMLQDPALTASALRPLNGMAPVEYEPRLPHSKPQIIFPSSGDTDEPLKEFQQAVDNYFPHNSCCRIIVTGKTARHAIQSDEILTPGFLARHDYVRMVSGSQIVVSLSTRPDILQRAAFEAVVEGKRPLVRESRPLRRIFGDFAEYAADCSPVEIGKALERAYTRISIPPSELREVRERILEQESAQILKLRSLI